MNLSDFMKNTKTPQEKSSAPDGGLTLNMDAPGVSAKSAETREAQPGAPDQKKKKGKKAKPPRQRHGCLWHFVSGFLGLFLTCGILVVVCVIFLFVWVSRDLPELDKITDHDHLRPRRFRSGHTLPREALYHHAERHAQIPAHVVPGH